MVIRKRGSELTPKRLLVILPVLLFVIQLAPWSISLIILIGILAILHDKRRIEAIVLMSSVLVGQLLYMLSLTLLPLIELPTELQLTVNRLAVLAYLLPFILMYRVLKKQRPIFKGNLSAPIFMPFIWRGKEETITSFLRIFLSGMLAITLLIFILNGRTWRIILFGLLLSVVNGVLEEILWRGYILSAMLKLVPKHWAVIISSLAFGIYHYCLGINLVMCLIFAIGGFYFGGVTIQAKGILPAISMHVVVNLLFVAIGIMGL